eukprot:CAMPEP_0171327134 /NCGR_PEP_ID=MMETSP0816-20121228/117883_1 /TAXON_ID=420281 /ORGANISM="Proboscia inermis, Strain CCAP1064/1" /LENGTH=130 /DNA_ID=CAMNT_0011826775 /DNA_START=3853 /DNA_END=4248 /DNA_ORIENTATION=-
MAYAGYPLVGDPLYRSEGIPDSQPRFFPKRKNEEEGVDTDEEKDDGEKEGVMRVPFPRDCGYSLHTYLITVEHPVTVGRWMTFTAMPPAHLEEGTGAVTQIHGTHTTNVLIHLDAGRVNKRRVCERSRIP